MRLLSSLLLLLGTRLRGEYIPDVRSVARSSNGRMKGGGDRVCGGGEEVEFKTVVLKC